MPVIAADLLKQKMIKAKHLEQIRWWDTNKSLPPMTDVLGWFYRDGRATGSKLLLVRLSDGSLYKKMTESVPSGLQQIFVD